MTTCDLQGFTSPLQIQPRTTPSVGDDNVYFTDSNSSPLGFWKIKDSCELIFAMISNQSNASNLKQKLKNIHIYLLVFYQQILLMLHCHLLIAIIVVDKSRLFFCIFYSLVFSFVFNTGHDSV